MITEGGATLYLSDRDLAWAIKTEKLIFKPAPEKYDPTSIDLHLDVLEEAKIWDIEEFQKHEKHSGRHRPELHIGSYIYGPFSGKYLRVAPPYDPSEKQRVGRRDNEIVVKPLGFVIWQTKEEVGTEPENAEYICFVNAKSTKARAGLVVHLTAPTIHAAWNGRITLEIVNLGPFDLVFRAGDVVAQLTVARITSRPERDVRGESQTYGQLNVHGKATKPAKPKVVRAKKTEPPARRR